MKKRIRVVMMVVMSLGLLTSAVQAKQDRIEYLENEIDRLESKHSEYTYELESLKERYPVIINSYHPQSEPEELYIVEFKTQENASVKTYRMYCPTGMVRDISNGSFKKARKAYIEDRVKYDNRMITRNVFESVCR
jgi:hypothetical protein